MSARGLDPRVRLLAVRNLAIDRLTAEIASELSAEGIESIVLKGPVLGQWLYPEEVRPYGDSDLMVAPENWQRAIDTLKRLGFVDYLGPMEHPRMESPAGTGFQRGQDYVDLHCTLHGLDGDERAVWESFLAASEAQTIGGTELRVPGRASLLLHLGLHAAHHTEGKPLEDLRRAIARAEEQLWRDAVELARSHDGLPAFASGLRLLPEGKELARQLAIGDVRSVRHDLRREKIPMAEGIDTLFSPGLGVRGKMAIAVSEMFPRREFMRWWSPLARRGRAGLLASYLWRLLWLVGHAPRAVLAWWRVRRQASSGR